MQPPTMQPPPAYGGTPPAMAPPPTMQPPPAMALSPLRPPAAAPPPAQPPPQQQAYGYDAGGYDAGGYGAGGYGSGGLDAVPLDGNGVGQGLEAKPAAAQVGKGGWLVDLIGTAEKDGAAAAAKVAGGALRGVLSWAKEKVEATRPDDGPYEAAPAYVYNEEVKAWIPSGMSAEAWLAEEERQRMEEEQKANPPPPPTFGGAPPTAGFSAAAGPPPTFAAAPPPAAGPPPTGPPPSSGPPPAAARRRGWGRRRVRSTRRGTRSPAARLARPRGAGGRAPGRATTTARRRAACELRVL